MFTETITAGRLTRDPVRRTYGEGGVIAQFTIAADIGRDRTSFQDCIAFNKTAETVLNYLTKGSKVLVAGTFQNNDTTREINGQEITNYGMNLVANQVRFLESRAEAVQNGTAANTNQQPNNNYGNQNQNQNQQQNPNQNQNQNQGQGQGQGNSFSNQGMTDNPFAGFGSDDTPF